jgi:urease accessory protein
VIPSAPSPGQGALRFVRAGPRTVVHTARAASPLRLLLPKNHGDAAWVYVASLGGGLVQGDALSVSIDVDAGGCALVGTQASTKVYRSPRGTSQALRARVAAGAMLMVIPDPVTCFAGASYEQRIDVELEDESASLVLVDTLTCGRAARGERWAFARYASRTRIGIGGRLLVHDAVHLDPDQGDLCARMGRFDAIATIAAFGPGATEVRERLVGAASSAPAHGAARMHAVTVLSPTASLGRVAAVSAQEAIAATRTLLAPIALALGDDPFARRW